MGLEAERFVYAVPHDAYCIICNLVLEDPVEITECEHYVCYSCWDKWKDGNNKSRNESSCPYCGIDIKTDKVRKTRLTWNLIQNMTVYCKNKNKGCECIYKLGFEDLHTAKCLYDTRNITGEIEKLEKCSTCNITLENGSKIHDCIKELIQTLKEQTTQISNLEHENNRLAFKLTTCEKEFLEERTENENQFCMESVKYQKEIRDLRTRLANMQGELGRRKGQTEVEQLKIDLERVNGSLGFNIIGGGASQDDKVSNGIFVSRIVEGGAADRPGKLQLHDRILEVDSVDLRNATHEVAVKTFRNSGDPVNMVVQRQIHKNQACDATTQTFGVVFAVTGDDAEDERNNILEGERKKNFKNSKARWLNPHEIADSVNLSCSEECVEILNQQNTDQNKDEDKSELYDSAYDTLLTQKSTRSTTRMTSSNEHSDVDSSRNTRDMASPDGSDTQGVVLRKKVTKDNSEKRLSTFCVIPGSEENNNAKENNWEDLNSGTEMEYEYEYEEVCLQKNSGRFGMVLCFGGNETDVAVYVGDLEEDSVADLSGKVMVGDQIVQINNAHVSDVDQAYRMLQENDEITLVVARAVYDPRSEYYDEAEETDLDMLDCINEEKESVFSKESSPQDYTSSVSSKSSASSRNKRSVVNDDTGDNSPSLDHTVGRSRAMTLSPVDNIPTEFTVPERRGRSISVNDSHTIDEKLDRKRNSSAESGKHDKESVKSSLKNFVKNKFGHLEKKDKRHNSHSDDSCDFDKLPRCDSNSSNNSNRSRNSNKDSAASKSDSQDLLKAKLKEQKQMSKMRAYIDSPSLQRHRINNNMVLFQNHNGVTNSPVTPVIYPGLYVNNMSAFTPINHMVTPNRNVNHALGNRNSMTASVTSLRSAMKNSWTNNNSPKATKHVQIDPHPGWNETERRVWEEFKIIQSMEAKENSRGDGDTSKVEAEWRVRRSKDGKHVYIKKTNSARSKIMKERAKQINDERCGITTDDDAFTVYQGQYWSRDQRRKQLHRHNDRRKRLLQKVADKAMYENKTEKAIAEIVQRKMTLPGAVFDNFVTVEEILSQRNRAGIFEGPIHVTTI